MKKIKGHEYELKRNSSKVINIADYIKERNGSEIKENPTEQCSIAGEQAKPFVDENMKKE